MQIVPREVFGNLNICLYWISMTISSIVVNGSSLTSSRGVSLDNKLGKFGEPNNLGNIFWWFYLLFHEVNILIGFNYVSEVFKCLF
jgi:hypothetical protein